jgi:hypothetical protein
MRLDKRQFRMGQLPLFSEDVELPCWHNLSESTRKDAVRYLAQIFGCDQETGISPTVPDLGAQDE